MSSQIYNPVLLHKVQGEEPCIEMENLKKEDMLLVVQTEFQRDMMIKFGNNIICLDATHGTTIDNIYHTRDCKPTSLTPINTFTQHCTLV